MLFNNIQNNSTLNNQQNQTNKTFNFKQQNNRFSILTTSSNLIRPFIPETRKGKALQAIAVVALNPFIPMSILLTGSFLFEKVSHVSSDLHEGNFGGNDRIIK